MRPEIVSMVETLYRLGWSTQDNPFGHFQKKGIVVFPSIVNLELKIRSPILDIPLYIPIAKSSVCFAVERDRLPRDPNAMGVALAYLCEQALEEIWM